MSDQFPPRPPGVPSNSPFGPGGTGQTPPPPAPGVYVPPPAPGFGQMPPYGMMPAPQATNGFAIASMVIGIVSLLLCYLGIVTGIVGLILGIVGLNQINADPERIGGKGMAIAGIVTSAIAIIFWGGGFVFFWGLGNWYGY